MLTFETLKINFAIESILKQVDTPQEVSSVQHSYFMVQSKQDLILPAQTFELLSE